jgi:hypothetical protein
MMLLIYEAILTVPQYDFVKVIKGSAAFLCANYCFNYSIF